jgi:HEAT repeat protein
MPERELTGMLIPSTVKSKSDPDDLVLADKQLLRQAEEILTAMANAVSAMKIFSSDHATVRNFIDGLTARFDEFFRSYQRLEVGVEEFAFTCAGQAVYVDEVPLKSLPFFFFKDGTQTLYFYRGLARDEIMQFLEIIRRVAHDPSGNNDIVAALWESDLSNIQYYAPDEFLENQILNEDKAVRADENLPELPSDLANEALEVKVDLAKFSQGRIEIKPDDLSKFHWAPGGEVVPQTEEDRDKRSEPDPSASPEESSGLDRSPAASADPNLSDSDLQKLESMVRANRVLCPEEEFVGLTTEVVFLESDLKICAEALDVLAEFALDQTRAGQFAVAGSAITKIGDLRAFLGDASPSKTVLIDACLRTLTGPRALQAVETFLATQAPLDGPTLLDFFKLLGPVTLPAVASIYESKTDLDLRSQILAFIERTAAGDPQLIVSLANDARLVLSLEIMRLLLRMPGDRGVASLLAFVMFKNRDIKLEVIHALGDMKSEMSNRILMAFLNDPDEDLRIQAAMKLDPSEERSRIDHVVREASSAAFRKKGLREKQAILTFLGRTRSAAALDFLTSAAVKTTLWPSRQNTEMRLAVILGLESMGTPEAMTSLESMARLRGRSVRLAAEEALARVRSAGGRE